LAVLFHAGEQFLAACGLVLLGTTACGDVLLPADYQGPPASAVGGSVVRTDNAEFAEATDPRFSVEWLSGSKDLNTGNFLFSQSVSFTRSQQLQKDWDLGIDLPKTAAKLKINLGSMSTNMAVGKLIYFDDKDGNQRLDWNCSSTKCDQVKAVSAEFVVYLDQPLTCPSKAGGNNERKNRLGGGFHYFEFLGSTPLEVQRNADLHFDLTETPSAWADPTTALQRFAQQFQRNFVSGAFSGCP
jgi:hypothetical protein